MATLAVSAVIAPRKKNGIITPMMTMPLYWEASRAVAVSALVAIPMQVMKKKDRINKIMFVVITNGLNSIEPRMDFSMGFSRNIMRPLRAGTIRQVMEIRPTIMVLMILPMMRFLAGIAVSSISLMRVSFSSAMDMNMRLPKTVMRM